MHYMLCYVCKNLHVKWALHDFLMNKLLKILFIIFTNEINLKQLNMKAPFDQLGQLLNNLAWKWTCPKRLQGCATRGSASITPASSTDSLPGQVSQRSGLKGKLKESNETGTERFTQYCLLRYIQYLVNVLYIYLTDKYDPRSDARFNINHDSDNLGVNWRR